MAEKVYLVDGSSYIFRAYYAVGALSTGAGFPTNALFGFSRMLLKLLAQADSQQIVVVFDAGKETFRNKLYPQYKANRDECPPDLLKQMPYFREISSALGLQISELVGFEADDIIGALARRLSAAGVETVIVSADKDLMQLVDNNVSMWDTMQDRRYGREEVRAKLGVWPEQVVDFLGLTGDTSDNVPGIKGVGPKTAAQLIEKYGNIENIIRSASSIREDKSLKNRQRISEQIESDVEVIRLSRKLVEVDTAAPVQFDVGDSRVEIGRLSESELVDATRRRSPDRERLRKLVEELEFSSLFKDLDLEPAPQKPASARDFNYRTIYAEGFAHWFEEFSRQTEFALDLETTSLNVLQAEIVGFAFCWSDKEAFYIPVGHKAVALGHNQISAVEVLGKCGAALRDSQIKKYGQNLKYDISVLARHGVELGGVAFDTMIASYLINPDRNSHGLTALAKDYLGQIVIEYTDVVGDKADFSYVGIVEATAYSAEDAHFAWLLTKKLEKLIAERGLEEVFYKIELPLVSVLSHMELKGIKLDAELLGRMSLQMAEQLGKLEKELYAAAGCEFNLNSPKQLADVLFNKLGILTKGLKKTKTGISTDSSVLEKLSDEHPLPGLILQYRMLHKLKSTYVDALPAQISPFTGRLHTKFNQAITGTGRLSSSEPNLQNIPIQSEEGRKIRSAFIAETGNVLISADYSQIELRVLAHMSKDLGLTEAFQNYMDIHAQTARELMNLPKDEILSPEIRRIGKTINFGVIYGMSGFRLGRDLGIPVGVASKYIENYFTHFAGVKKFFAQLEAEAEERGFVSTLFGRRRVIGDIDTSGRDPGFLRRVAVNAPIQGTAADIIKLAMSRIEDRILRERLPLAMILQIHDELVFECQVGFRESAVELIRQEMENIVKLSVPLEVDVRWGYNWEEAH